MDAFTHCVEFVLRREGGYIDDPRDPGGETNWGISRRQYPNLDIAALTHEQAIDLYRADYWDKCRCEEMPTGVALMVFDAAVNQGPGRAVAWLQAALGVPVDGDIGPVTLGALERANPFLVLRTVAAFRALTYMMDSDSRWAAFGDGWRARLKATMRASIQLLGPARATV